MIPSEAVVPQVSSAAVLGGTGRHGSGLAQRLARGGVHVTIGSRDPTRAADVVRAWSEADRLPIDVADNATAAGACDTIVIAVPFHALDALLGEIGPRLRSGAVVVDVTVPVAFAAGKMTMLDVAEGSASEHVRARLPPGVSVAGAFKTLPAHLLCEFDRSVDCDDFVCGDSDAARAAASDLLRAVPGLRPVDVGPLSRARAIEHVTALAIAINRRHKIRDARFRVVGLA